MTAEYVFMFCRTKGQLHNMGYRSNRRRKGPASPKDLLEVAPAKRELHAPFEATAGEFLEFLSVCPPCRGDVTWKPFTTTYGME
jgi:hypothetical protein